MAAWTGMSRRSASATATATTAAPASSSCGRPTATAAASRRRGSTRGHFGEVRLDGLCFAVIYAWPGAVYEGDGTMQAIIDERADEGQRAALATILHGGETDEAQDPLVGVPRHVEHGAPDALRRRSSSRSTSSGAPRGSAIPGVLRAEGRPIMSPVTGEPHRVRLDMPEGIEFALAEIGSASTSATGAVRARPRRQLRPVQHPALQPPRRGARLSGRSGGEVGSTPRSRGRLLLRPG